MQENSVVGIIIATHLEGVSFVDGFSLQPYEDRPFFVYRNEKIVLIISGIGKANAAMACIYLSMKFHPSCIYNLGAAGATDISFPLGSIYHINKVIEPDRPDLETGIPHEYIPDVVKGYPTAILATQDKPIREPVERQRISSEAELVDMEGAAVAQACRLLQIRCMLFKFVSDNSQDHDIINNIIRYRDPFRKFFCKKVLSSSPSLRL
jgi:adenosylhomocysteine nucleosidase